MRTEHVMALWQGPLRKYIVSQAWRHAREHADAEDYMQEAWLAISRLGDQAVTPGGADQWWHDKDQRYYERVAYNAIHAAWGRNRRYSERVRRLTDEEGATGVIKRGHLTDTQRAAAERSRAKYRLIIPGRSARGAPAESASNP